MLVCFPHHLETLQVAWRILISFYSSPLEQLLCRSFWAKPIHEGLFHDVLLHLFELICDMNDAQFSGEVLDYHIKHRILFHVPIGSMPQIRNLFRPVPILMVNNIGHPEIGLPRVIIHFFIGFSLTNQPFWGTPMAMESPTFWVNVFSYALPRPHRRRGFRRWCLLRRRLRLKLKGRRKRSWANLGIGGETYGRSPIAGWFTRENPI